MRIAISGTHCCGKSTLIDAFLAAHGDYFFEPEPYEALQDLYGEIFAAEPSADDFHRQLEYQVSRLHEYQVGNLVMFERSPVDYLAYLLALGDLDRNTADTRLTERSIDVARGAVDLLDVIVFLRPTDGAGRVSNSEDPELRHAVDLRLEGILLGDDFDMFTTSRPSILEAFGTTAQRLRSLEVSLSSGRSQ